MNQIRATLLSVAFASLALPVAAQNLGLFKDAKKAPTTQVRPLGPLGGSAFSIALDPQDDDVLLAIKYQIGLFRSTDAGISFALYGTGITPDISRLTLDPRDDQTLFAIDSFFQVVRSTDFGATWSPLGLVAQHNLRQIGVPSSGTDLLAVDSFNVYHSADDGATWTVVASTVPFAGTTFESVAYAPSDPSIAYFTTNEGVYRSTDGGRSFTKPAPGFTEWIQHMTVSPTDPDTVLAGAWNAYWRSTDGGASFTQITSGLPPTVNAEFFRWENDSTVWYGTLNGVYFSTDAGLAWNDANNGFPTVRPIPGGIAFDSQGSIYLGTESNFINGYVGGGVHKRTSATAPWEHIAYGDIPISDVQVGVGGTRIAGTLSGPYMGDRGEQLEGTPWISEVHDVLAHPTLPDRFITGGVGSFIDNAQIVTHSNGGAQFNVVYEQLGAGVVQDVVIDPNDPRRLLAGIYPAQFGNEAIVRSSNGAASWTDVPGTSGWATRAIAFDPHKAGRVLQLSDSNNWAESQDAGQTWGGLQLAWPGTGPACLLAFDPFVPGVLYRGEIGTGLWRSDDDGDSWTALGVSLHADSDIELHPENPGLFWVSDASGKVLVSGDRGDSFSTFYTVGGGANAAGLALDPTDGSILVGTTGASVWEVTGGSGLVMVGDGSAGSGGFVPRHYSVGGPPKVGNADWGFAGDRILDGASSFLLLGTNEVSQPFFGGTLVVGSPRRVIRAGEATGAAGAGGTSSTVVSMPIPNTPELNGATIVSQYLILDPAVGVVLSNGLRTTLLP